MTELRPLKLMSKPSRKDCKFNCMRSCIFYCFRISILTWALHTFSTCPNFYGTKLKWKILHYPRLCHVTNTIWSENGFFWKQIVTAVLPPWRLPTVELILDVAKDNEVFAPWTLAHIRIILQKWQAILAHTWWPPPERVGALSYFCSPTESLTRVPNLPPSDRILEPMLSFWLGTMYQILWSCSWPCCCQCYDLSEMQTIDFFSLSCGLPNNCIFSPSSFSTLKNLGWQIAM